MLAQLLTHDCAYYCSPAAVKVIFALADLLDILCFSSPPQAGLPSLALTPPFARKKSFCRLIGDEGRRSLSKGVSSRLPGTLLTQLWQVPVHHSAASSPIDAPTSCSWFVKSSLVESVYHRARTRPVGHKMPSSGASRRVSNLTS